MICGCSLSALKPNTLLRIERFLVTFIPMSTFGYLYLLFARSDDDDPISKKNLFFANGFIIGVPLSQREDA